ncbi:MAG: type II toxin-antitoxin system RelE/ParE family toxin [Woeseiaceae bacterium]
MNGFALDLQKYARTAHLRDIVTLDVHSYASPANRLEKLRGNRAGQHSIRINRQYRVCFVWRAGDAYQVEIVDYH